VSNFFSVGPTLRSWANKALKFFSLSGGGGDKDFWARLLYISYMNELLTAIHGFDSSEDLNAKYFYGLARVVLAHLDTLDKKNLDYKNLIQFLYKGIPDGEWGSRNDYASFVSSAGGSISLKAVNMMDGIMPDFGYEVQNYEQTVVRYGVYNNVCAKLPEQDRKRLLVHRLANYTASLPEVEVVKGRNFSKESPAFFEQLRSMPPADLKRLIAESKLTEGEMRSFLLAYQQSASSMLKEPGPAVNLIDRRETVKSGVMGGKKTKRKTRRLNRKKPKGMM
jgi:hypothetical protein